MPKITIFEHQNTSIHIMQGAKVKPKKYLGQHFLTDENIARQIAHAVQKDADCFNCVEIGPGMGVLSKYLVEQFDAAHFKMVEIDMESVAYLKKHFSDYEVLAQDFLEHGLDYFGRQPFVVAGNFPYNISSQIFFKILENPDRVPQVVCMLQKEVAVRLASPPGNRDYGILSVLLQVYYDMEYLFTVEPNVFYPPPKVQSGVIRLKRRRDYTLPVDFDLFKHVVKMAFNQRRKTLRNALKGHAKFASIAAHPLMDKRAEQLGVLEFEELARLLT